MQSQIFGVKSNAARAAAKHGIKRDQLIAVSGGWCPSETAPQSPTEPATEGRQRRPCRARRPTAWRSAPLGLVGVCTLLKAETAAFPVGRFRRGC